ncbi:poly(3-hydroxybutyrate) depolymerase [Propionivibrio sp.]|uniref:extracellular catalytic domain type 2 short-chain-length polyhydroxyalkanoate depolymerase n=1 Tax=Propionivibrio sp. TaxID=2212460 RepID=UPI0025E8D5AC|nr:poly(3-hydroxybutyrate) depolymerase [Propionivibrio sp.]
MMSIFLSRRLHRLFFLLAAFAASLPAVHGATPEKLPALNIDIGETSISGLSSGAFASVQFQVAYSSIVKGAGVIAGGPFFCSQGNVLRATTQCSCTIDPAHKLCGVSKTSTELPILVSETRQFAAQGLIDDPANLTRQRVLILAGDKDQTVPVPIAEQLSDYYSLLAVPEKNLVSVRLSKASHTMPTLDYGKDCGVSESPYIGKCKFDAAKVILNWIYGDLKKPKQGPVSARLVQFDQTPYVPGNRFSWSSGMDSTGWAYIPAACARGEACRLHVALHGCKQGQNYLPLRPVQGGDLYYGTTFVRNAGYNRWAESNHIVVLYPQAVSIPDRNPNGCWDWWGYTDENFATRKGVQLSAIRAMVEQITSGRR